MNHVPLAIGLTGLSINQRLLDLTGQNITNAQTPGYHNQIADLAEINAGTGGAGVEITRIGRSVDQIVQEAVVNNTSAANNASTQLNGLNQLQSYLATGSGTLHDSLVTLFSDLESLTAQPSDVTQRQVVLADANNVTTQLNATVANLNQMSSGLVAQAKTYTDQINTLTTQIAQLNQQIHDTTVTGGDANGLLDQRDQALDNLSQLVEVRTLQQPFGQISVFTGGTALVLNTQAASLATTIDSQGNLVVTLQNAQQPLDIQGGNLGGTLTLHNTTLPAVQAQLNTFAQTLVTQFDHIESTGLGLNGPLTSLTSQRTVADVNEPLAATNLQYPPSAGNLYLTVTNLASGQRTLNKVAIDPKTQSLTDIANAINAVPHLQALVDPQNGTLHLLAQTGYGFDFTGNLSTSPDTQAITGSVVPSIDGQYTGSSDDTLNFHFVGSGTIGVTPNLTLQVTNSAGTLLGSLNVGQGYAAGTDLAGVEGIQVKLTAGTVNNGDSFSVNATADSDSARLLPALGLNTFFTGNNADDLQVNPNLQNSPQQLAFSTTGQPGDGSNLAKLVALQNQPVLANKTQSLLQYLENSIGTLGTQTHDMQTSSTAYDALGQQLNAQLQSATGVDPNEALMQLVQYQRSYQMSAEFISVVNQTLNALFAIVLPT